MGAITELARYAGGGLRVALGGLREEECPGVTDVRFRVDKPVIIRQGTSERFLAPDGSLLAEETFAYRPTRKDITATLEQLAEHSLHAFLEELRNGYITLPGGHRVGVSGQCVVENGRVKMIKNVTSLCFRAAKEIVGCANNIINYISYNSQSIYHTMIISPPGCGKTTLLRDVIRLVSSTGNTVGVVDERSELAGARSGGELELGPRTDVLEGCPKVIGMRMLLRSMSPDIIAVDEIGRRDELDVVTDIVNAGVTLICTAHGANVQELRERPVFEELLARRTFRRFVVLGCGETPGEVLGVYNERFEDVMDTPCVPE